MLLNSSRKVKLEPCFFGLLKQACLKEFDSFQFANLKKYGSNRKIGSQN